MKLDMIIDNFAGGGGASLGIAWATGRSPDIAINHDGNALKMHEANHPSTRHVREDVWKAKPRKLTKGRKVSLAWFSPDCKHFSSAKGDKPVEKNIRSLAWVVVKWAIDVKPSVIFLENVREFEFWGPIIPRFSCRCGWKGTEGQAKLARTRRRCPTCNSANLKQTDRMVPDPDRKGLTFKRWVGRLKNLGYKVEWRQLNAADHGAPTHRRRLFLVARCDGQPIEWPEPTHGDPKKLGERSLFGPKLKPWRTAAECIDWSIPCPSIFDRKRPLAEKTMRRIALGIKRYVLENPKPFIVQLCHGGGGTFDDSRSKPLDSPLGTIHAGGANHALVTPVVVGVGGRAGQSPATSGGRPLGTITAKADKAIVTPIIARISQGGGNGKYVNGSDEPLTTIVSKQEHLLVAPTLIQTGYGERPGQAPRVPGLDKPLGTVVSGGKHALVAAFCAKHFGGEVGCGIDTPLPTTTARGTQNQLVAANLVHMNHGEKQWSDVEEPLRTLTTGRHAALVYSLLIRYFGTAIGQHLSEPLYTITGKARFALVTVSIDGELYVIVDIGMRMLSPRELARAQGFPDTYILTGTKTSQVARIGNSVVPHVASALVKANCCVEAAEVA